MEYWYIKTKRIDDKKAQNDLQKKNPFKDKKFAEEKFAVSALACMSDDLREHYEVAHVFGSVGFKTL